MTRRAGGADSRPAPMEQSDRPDTPPLHHGTTQHHSQQAKETAPRKETDTRLTTHSTQHSTASAERPHRTAQHSQQSDTRRVMKRDTHELYRTQAILSTRRAAHASNIARVARLIRAHAMGGTRGHSGRGRPTHKRSIFKPGYCTHGLFIAPAFGYPYSVAQYALQRFARATKASLYRTTVGAVEAFRNAIRRSQMDAAAE